MWEVLTQKQKMEAFRVFALEEKARLERQRRLRKKIVVLVIMLIISRIVFAVSLS